MALTGTSIGGQVLIYVDGTAIAHSTSATLNISKDMIPAVSKDTTNQMREKYPGAGEWSVDFGGLYVYSAAYGPSDIFALLVAGTQANIKFSPNTSGNKYFHGNGYFTSLTLDAPDQDNTTFTGSFDGDGALTESSLT